LFVGRRCAVEQRDLHDGQVGRRAQQGQRDPGAVIPTMVTDQVGGQSCSGEVLMRASGEAGISDRGVPVVPEGRDGWSCTVPGRGPLTTPIEGLRQCADTTTIEVGRLSVRTAPAPRRWFRVGSPGVRVSPAAP
jgi:hypothetical protein